ncbi:MAG: ATP-binding cassette domain-containing protein [Acutalibacteraceae bacterium]|jgi:ABC-type taurine transport system ATPase subunit
MIEIRGLSFRYAGESRDALHNIDMTVEDGDFIGVTGRSGAGKTTLTQALSGLVPHRRAGDFFGSVTVNGVDTVDSSLTALALHVGSVFQDIDSQMVAGQVEDEILFGLENFGVDRAEIPRRIDEALGDVGIAPLRHRAIDSLSGIMEAQTARGVAFDTKNPFKKLGLILPLCMPLLISSVGRIHDTAAAAEMRGFTLRTRESQSRRYTFKSGDLFAALIAAALVAAGALL